MNRSSATNNWHESNATDGAVVVSKVVSPPEDPIRPRGVDRPTSVIMSATVRSTGLSSLFVRHQGVDFSVLKKIDDARFPGPEAITLDNFRTFTSFLDSLFICPGNPDLRFVQLCRSRKGFLRDIKDQFWLHWTLTVALPSRAKSLSIRSGEWTAHCCLRRQGGDAPPVRRIGVHCE